VTVVSRRVLVLIGLVVVLGGAAGALIVRDRSEAHRRKPVPLDIPAAEQLARRACAGIATFEQQVDANASAEAVFQTLDGLRSAANAAADRDPRWRSLASGTDALDVALRKNDAAAARVGIDVVRAQCADVA
jgi:hypothetical protein